MTSFSFEHAMAGIVVVGARLSGVMVSAPFFGSDVVPMRVKGGLLVALTLLLSPMYTADRLSLDPLSCARLIVGEACLGLVFGLVIHFIFDAAQIAGQFLGVQMGFSLVSVIDPQTQADSPVLAMFHQIIVLLIFLELNVHHWLLRGLAASFSYVPPGHFHLTSQAVSLLIRAAGAMWLAGVQLAAPAILATMLADVGLGFLGKASPQLPVLFFGLSIKNLLGLTVLIAAVAVWPGFFEKHFADVIVTGEKLLRLGNR
jgi:flagellar biosynthesis protein FliR